VILTSRILLISVSFTRFGHYDIHVDCIHGVLCNVISVLLSLDEITFLHRICMYLQPDYVKIATYCNIWRNFNDIDDSWDSVNKIITFYGDDKTGFTEVAAPGSFNDPDMVSSV